MYQYHTFLVTDEIKKLVLHNRLYMYMYLYFVHVRIKLITLYVSIVCSLMVGYTDVLVSKMSLVIDDFQLLHPDSQKTIQLFCFLLGINTL